MPKTIVPVHGCGTASLGVDTTLFSLPNPSGFELIFKGTGAENTLVFNALQNGALNTFNPTIRQGKNTLNTNNTFSVSSGLIYFNNNVISTDPLQNIGGTGQIQKLSFTWFRENASPKQYVHVPSVFIHNTTNFPAGPDFVWSYEYYILEL